MIHVIHSPNARDNEKQEFGHESLGVRMAGYRPIIESTHFLEMGGPNPYEERIGRGKGTGTNPNLPSYPPAIGSKGTLTGTSGRQFFTTLPSRHIQARENKGGARE